MKYNAVKGVRDILPPEVYTWQWVEAAAREIFGVYGYQEIRPPIMEFTDLFVRSIGEGTDIVEKEMYTFMDKAQRSITLRPEGTAPIVRGYIENHLFTLPRPQKFYYSGPMFRYERPQKGRSRQFHQIGVESFGVAEPGMDAEVIAMLRNFLQRIGLDGLNFEINSIGCPECRPGYREALEGFFSARLDDLCPDCKRRYGQNPLRILDCKVSACIEQRSGAPAPADYLCNGCREHFSEVRALLGSLGVSHVVNPAMVRGLDYYTRTIFEVTGEVTGKITGEVAGSGLGAQNAVAAGGRYDGLVEEFGGPPTPAIGFALGMERIIALTKKTGDGRTPDIFVAAIGRKAAAETLQIAERFRADGMWVELGYGEASLRSQMRRADKLGASYVFMIGEDELEKGAVKWKDLRDGSTGEVGMEEIYNVFRKKI